MKCELVAELERHPITRLTDLLATASPPERLRVSRLEPPGASARPGSPGSPARS
jgi:hypothetical protein